MGHEEVSSPKDTQRAAEETQRTEDLATPVENNRGGTAPLGNSMTREELATLRNYRIVSKSWDSGGSRTSAQRDRDRILYSTAFRRLAEITQVVSATEGHHFHNRLTHVLKVAQIGRRIAERLINTTPPEILHALGGLDPEVVEAAGLAHDLGHPPFGHIAEAALQSTCQLSKEAFEGNAQSFRIVTKLAIRSNDDGLDLTRATLNAILKYPWGQQKHLHKWGVYNADRGIYTEARKAAPFLETKTLEAEIMDWADDIAYAVYDLDDFYRAGLIPLDRLSENAAQDPLNRRGPNAFESFIESVKDRWARMGKADEKKLTTYKDQFKQALTIIFRTHEPLLNPYAGTHEQRASLRDLTSFLVGRYADALKLSSEKDFLAARPFSGETIGPSPVMIDSVIKGEVAMLKELTWTYVIENPSLAAQQEGQRRIIKMLYKRLDNAAVNEDWNIFPSSLRHDLKANFASFDNDPTARARVVIDLISSMTEAQAIGLYQRLTGYASGSIHHRVLD